MVLFVVIGVFFDKNCFFVVIWIVLFKVLGIMVYFEDNVFRNYIVVFN